MENNPLGDRPPAINGQNDNLEDNAQNEGNNSMPGPPVQVNKKTPNNHKFSPIVGINNTRVEFGLRCSLFVKCSHLNEPGLARYSLGLPVLDLSPPHDMLITWSRHDLALGLCYAGAIKGNPHTSLVKMSTNVRQSNRLSDNDVNLLRCFGITIITDPNSTTLVDLEAQVEVDCSRDRLVFKYAMAKEACKGLRRVHSSTSVFTDDQYGLTIQDEMVQPLFEIIVQTKGLFDLLVCDIATARILLNSKILEEFVKNYQVACIEAYDPDGEDETWLGVDYPVSTQIVRFKVPLSAARAMTYSLLHDEGILCSVKSGLIMAGTVIAAKKFGYDSNPKAKVITLLPEGLFHETRPESLEQDWMLENMLWTTEYFESNQCWWWNVSLSELSLKPIAITYPSMTIEETIQFMKESMVDRAGIGYQDSNRDRLEGVVFLSHLESYINCDDLEFYEERVGNPGEKPVSSVMSSSLEYADINNMRMGEISSVLVNTEYLVVTLRLGQEDDQLWTEEKVVGIVSAEDLIKYKKQTLLHHLDQGYNLKG